VKLELVSLLSPSWIHPAYIGAIAATCMSDPQSPEDLVQEATFKLNGLKTAIQTFHKMRSQQSVCGDEAQTMEEVVCVLLQLCLVNSGGSGGQDEQVGSSRLAIREEVRVTLLSWIRNEMSALLSRPAVADMLLMILRQTFGPYQPSPVVSSTNIGTVSMTKHGGVTGVKLQGVVLGLANVLSKYVHSYIGVEVTYSYDSSFSSDTTSISRSSLPQLLQCVSAALIPFADKSFSSSTSRGPASGRSNMLSDEHEILMKKVSDLVFNLKYHV
jgi:hypothetical protein